MTPLALVTGGTDAERALDLFLLYDAVSGFPGSMTALFEHHCPGATEALKAWASARCLEWVDIHVPDAPVPTRVVRAECLGGGTITVLRNA